MAMELRTWRSTAGVSILIGADDGTFRRAGNLDPGSLSAWIAAGDFDGDRKLDLAATTFANTVTMLKNTTAGRSIEPK